MDNIIKNLQLKAPRCLPVAVVVATALTHTGGAITGSCASDLFRTAILKKFPFPLGFGVAGDGVWSLHNAGRVKWAATPEKFTTFRRHPPTASAQEIQAGGYARKYSQLAAEMVDVWLAGCPGDFPGPIMADMKQLLARSIDYEHCQRHYNSYRKNRWPWSLNPAAWRARTRQNQVKRQVLEIKARIFRKTHPVKSTATPI